MLQSITRDQIDIASLAAAVADVSHGATSIFVGTVRSSNDGNAVTGIDYSGYEPMAQREIGLIESEARSRFDGAQVAVQHRLGTLAVGEISIVVAAAHARRAQSIDAMRYVIEEIKRRVPIWKREHYSDGRRVWVDPTGKEAA